MRQECIPGGASHSIIISSRCFVHTGSLRSEYESYCYCRHTTAQVKHFIFTNPSNSIIKYNFQSDDTTTRNNS